MLTFDMSLVLPWVANRCNADPRYAQSAIGWTRDDVLTCGIFYEQFTGKSITATFAMAPGAVFPKEFLRAIFAYPFIQLGVWKMLAYVAESNYKSQNMVEKMGFEKEAIITDYYPDGDMFIYAMTKHQCRWLAEENENGQG